MFDENNPFRESQNRPKVNPKVNIFPWFRICSNRCEHDGSYLMNMCDIENRTKIFFFLFYPGLILCLSFKTQNFAVDPDISGFPRVPTCTTLGPCFPFFHWNLFVKCVNSALLLTCIFFFVVVL